MTHENFPPCLYVGVPGSGKTTRALKEAGEFSRALGWPILCVDSQGTISALPLAASVRDALEACYGRGEHVRIVPGKEGHGEVEKIAAAARACGRVVLLVDEVAYWASSRGTPPELETLLRAWRHASVVILMTTQYPGDVSPVVCTCAGRVVAFRCDALAALARLRDQWAMEPEKIRALEKFSCIEWKRW